MRRLVWAFAGRTYHIVGNLMLQLHLRKPRVLTPLRSLRKERRGVSTLGLRRWLQLIYGKIHFLRQTLLFVTIFPWINSSENTCFPSEVMTATEATIGEFIWVPFLPIIDGNIRVLTIAYKQKWPFPLLFAKLYAFFWLDLINLLSLLGQIVFFLPLPCSEIPTTHVIRFGRTPMTHIIWKLFAPTTHRKIYRLQSSAPRSFFLE